MGQVELKIINRGVILAEQRGHERGPVIGSLVFERSPVQRGTAMQNSFNGHKVYSMANYCCGSAQWGPIELLEHGNGHSVHHSGVSGSLPTALARHHRTSTVGAVRVKMEKSNKVVPNPLRGT